MHLERGALLYGHAKIQAPGAKWADGKVPEEVEAALSNLEDPEAVQQLRFPLSVGDGRNELDKTGAPCTVGRGRRTSNPS